MEERIRIALEIAPDLPNIQESRLIHLLREGRYDEARAFADRMSTIRHRQGELREMIDWLESGAQSAPSESVLKTLGENASYTYLSGRYDLWFESIRAAGEKWPEWYISPFVDLLSPIGEAEKRSRFLSDPRTKAYIRKLRLPEYWRQVGWPDICRPVGAEDFACS